MRRDQLLRMLNATLPHVDPGFRDDANETMAFARQLEYFFAKLYEVEYPESMGRVLVPVDYSVPSGALAHTYRLYDQIGEADIIDTYADDLKMVDETGAETAMKIIGIGDAFFISLQQLRSSVMAGLNLDQRKAKVARQAIERKLDKLICIGDSRVNMTGFANDANVPVVTATTGSWATATAVQIQADIEKFSKSIFDATKGVHGNPDNGSKLTLVLAPVDYSRIASLRIDTFNMMTVLEYELAHNPFVGDIKCWARLATADAGGTGPRAVLYSKNPDVLSAVIPQEFEILPMQPKALGYQVPCHMRFGGTVIRYPKAMAYMDLTT